jgi:hypothetical protein
VTRLILLILLAAAVVAYFPESRSWALDTARPALTPFFRWQTNNEMNEIARGLQTFERENYGRLPDRRQWRSWLETNYQGDAATDSWGERYHLTSGADSFRIVSSGPDRVYRSEDDLVVARRLARPGR